MTFVPDSRPSVNSEPASTRASLRGVHAVIEREQERHVGRVLRLVLHPGVERQFAAVPGPVAGEIDVVVDAVEFETYDWGSR